MPYRLQKEMDRIKKQLLTLGTVVEERVNLAVKSIEGRNEELAQKIVKGDIEIDRAEVDLEEECLKLLALYQPVAIDLRFIVAVLKINNDLERVADLAVNIAERAVFLAEHEKIDIPFDFPNMAEKVKTMLKKSIDALINNDSNLAYEVRKADNEVDEIHREMYQQVEQRILKNPDRISCYIQVMGVSRYLERIADHATNIAEDVIYLHDGTIVRHPSALQEH